MEDRDQRGLHRIHIFDIPPLFIVLPIRCFVVSIKELF